MTDECQQGARGIRRRWLDHHLVHAFRPRCPSGQQHPRHGPERLQLRARRIEEMSSVKMIALHIARRGSIFDRLQDISQAVWREPERGRCRLRSTPYLRSGQRRSVRSGCVLPRLLEQLVPPRSVSFQRVALGNFHSRLRRSQLRCSSAMSGYHCMPIRRPSTTQRRCDIAAKEFWGSFRWSVHDS